jgi:hypothetical protein
LVESSIYEQVQVIASYTREKTNEQLLDDLKSAVSGDKTLVILPDMQNSTRELNLESEAMPGVSQIKGADVPIARH